MIFSRKRDYSFCHFCEKVVILLKDGLKIIISNSIRCPRFGSFRVRKKVSDLFIHFYKWQLEDWKLKYKARALHVIFRETLLFLKVMILTHFSPMIYFYTPKNARKYIKVYTEVNIEVSLSRAIPIFLYFMRNLIS